LTNIFFSLILPSLENETDINAAVDDVHRHSVDWTFGASFRSFVTVPPELATPVDHGQVDGVREQNFWTVAAVLEGGG